MFNKKMIIGAVLILTVAFQAGCSVKDSQQSSNTGEPVKQETTENSAANQEDKQKSVMDAFSALAEKDTDLPSIVKFIDQNISVLSKENASVMVNKLEEIQKKSLPELDEKFYSSESMQKKINKVYTPEFDINKIEHIDDQELKALLTEVRDSGYKVETAEGMYFPIINYASYKKYASNVTPDMKAYIDIMTVESDKVPAKDAALVIGWDDVLERALNQEKFINQHPDSIKLNDVKQLYQKYVSFVFYGLNNTPLFSYDTKAMADEAKSVYIKEVGSNENSKLLETLRNYLDVLEKSHYKLTDEVEKFRKSASENM